MDQEFKMSVFLFIINLLNVFILQLSAGWGNVINT